MLFSLNLLYYKCVLPFPSIFCSVPACFVHYVNVFPSLSCFLSVWCHEWVTSDGHRYSSLAPARARRVFIILITLIGRVIIDPIRIHHMLVPGVIRIHRQPDPKMIGLVNDDSSVRADGTLYPRGCFFVHLFMLAQARLTAVCCSPVVLSQIQVQLILAQVYSNFPVLLCGSIQFFEFCAAVCTYLDLQRANISDAKMLSANDIAFFRWYFTLLS